MAAPDEASIPWPEHALAVSGGEILATHILPRMGHAARDFARAAAVCPGWRAAARAATPSVLYREAALVLTDTVEAGKLDYNADTLAWSPCGKYVAAATYRPYQVLLWQTSTGALEKAWDVALGADLETLGVLRGCVQVIVFSRDGSQLLAQSDGSSVFSLWSVPDGQLIAATPIDNFNVDTYVSPDIGVPGSASDGLVGLGLCATGRKEVHLFDVSPPPEGEPNLPRLKDEVVLGPVGGSDYVRSFAFSPDGNKFAAVCGDGTAYVYDVASLTRLGTYAMPWQHALATWVPGSQHVLLSCQTTHGASERACLWDFSRPEAPAVVTASVGPCEEFQGWSPSGTAYLVCRELDVRRAPNGPRTYAVELRRAVDGSVIRAVSLQSSGSDPKDSPYVFASPDSRALLVYPSRTVPARIVVFD